MTVTSKTVGAMPRVEMYPALDLVDAGRETRRRDEPFEHRS